MTTIFDYSFGEIYEYTPLAGLTPPSGIGKGTIVKVSSGTFQDKKYVYKWDGYHDGVNGRYTARLRVFMSAY
jgi:hypothetical protein